MKETPLTHEEFSSLMYMAGLAHGQLLKHDSPKGWEIAERQFSILRKLDPDVAKSVAGIAGEPPATARGPRALPT